MKKPLTTEENRRRRGDRTNEYAKRNEKNATMGLPGAPAKMVRGNETFRRLLDAGAILYNQEGEPYLLIVSNPVVANEESGQYAAYPIVLTDLAELTDRGYREIKHERVVEILRAEREAKKQSEIEQRIASADRRFDVDTEEDTDDTDDTETGYSHLGEIDRPDYSRYNN